MRRTGPSTATCAHPAPCRTIRHAWRGAGCCALISLLPPLLAGCAGADALPAVGARPAIVQGHVVPVAPASQGAHSGSLAAGSSGTRPRAETPSPSALYFASDVYEVGDADRSALKAHARRLLAHPELRLRIVAHTDPQGPPDYNAELARMRALSVKRVLLGLGVPAAQLETAAPAGASGARKHFSRAQMAALRRVDLLYGAQD